MIADVLLLLLGLVALAAGGELLVRGSVGLARRLGLSELVIGLTVVAFGTSLPELVVNLVASLAGRTQIGFGNVVGSNIANVGLILAVAVLIRPMAVSSEIVRREVPMMILASAAACALGWDGALNGRPAALDRGDALLLLLLFGVFLYYTLLDALSRKDVAGESALPLIPLGRSVPLVLVGLAVLVIGGRLTVKGAVGLAGLLGASEALIALTVVAVGTSLPELAASAMAAWRGHGEIAVGNVVGSCIFNLLFILGVSGLIAPLQVPVGGGADLLVMCLFAVLLLPLARSGMRLSRIEAAGLLVLYVAFVLWRALGG